MGASARSLLARRIAANLLPENVSELLGDTSTLSDDSPGRLEERWWVAILHHPDRNAVGIRSELSSQHALELGRGAETFGPGRLDDSHISRNHARVEIREGRPFLVDTESHNGSYVNGARATDCVLVAQDVIGVGRLLLLVERMPPAPGFEAPDGFVGGSHAIAAALLSIERVAAKATPVLLVGEAGTGKDRLARHVHERSGRSGRFTAVRCSAWTGDAFDHDGTLYLDGVGDLDESVEARVLELFDHGPRVVASSLGANDTAGLRPDLRHRLCNWSVAVPPLRNRGADVALLAHAFAERFASEPVALAAELSFRVARHNWPGNVRELEAVIERAVVESDGPTVDVFADLDAILAEPRSARLISTLGRDTVNEPFVIDRVGRWYCTPGGERHDLDRKPTLARLLAALVRERERELGATLSLDALLAKGWPDQKLLRKAGANRVYVAITTLRKAGLRDVLARTRDGYYLDPDVAVRVADA